MSRFVQKYYSMDGLAWIFPFAVSSIPEWMKAAEFGPQEELLRRGKDIRIPTSGVLLFIQANLNRHDEAKRAADDKVKGRALGEARRRWQQSQDRPNV